MFLFGLLSYIDRNETNLDTKECLFSVNEGVISLETYLSWLSVSLVVVIAVFCFVSFLLLLHVPFVFFVFPLYKRLIVLHYLISLLKM